MAEEAHLGPVQRPPEEQAYYDHLSLLPPEIFWRDHQIWLAERGYMLRPRYRPGWTPSWNGTGQSWLLHEDGHALSVRSCCVYFNGLTDELL